jgi:DNA polymerase-1
MSNLLVIDTSYLSWCCFYAMRHQLNHGEINTTVTFGVLKMLVNLHERYLPAATIWALDSRQSLRRKEFPEYKSSRDAKTMSAKDIKKRKAMKKQVKWMTGTVLPELGYKNIFEVSGYEADDIIAAITAYEDDNQVIIVSADEDLYQCLDENVSIWTRKKLITLDTFRDTWKLEPWQWVDVKAIAGCSSDDIPGVDGVGEKTAAKYLRGELRPSSKAAMSIESSSELIKRNRSLVNLPYSGCPEEFVIRKDQVTPGRWAAVCSKYGMMSLVKQAPSGVR